MKQILIILGLFASVTTFAQSPRIKLNQITKDTVKGSVLISNPTDSGMVYSRDFYIAYGVDTVLILYGDTLAATSGIISSVLSDGVTITGNGTSGNELKVDTSIIATIKALNDSLATVSASTTPDGVTITGDGSGGNPLKVDTLLISTIQGLVDTLTARGYLTAEVDGSITNELQTISTSGAAGNITLSDGGGTLNLNVDDSDASATNEGSLTVGAGTASTSVISSNTSGSTDVTLTAGSNITLSETGNNITIASTGGGTSYNNISENGDTVIISDHLKVDTNTLYVDATQNRVGIGTASPSVALEINKSFGVGDGIRLDNNGDGYFQVTNSSGVFQPIFQGQNGNADRSALIFRGLQNNDTETASTVRFIARQSDNASAVTTASPFEFSNGSTVNLEIQADGDVIVPSGNVGIGTTSPATKFNIENNVGGDTEFRIFNTSNGTGARALMRVGHSATEACVFYTTGSSYSANTSLNGYANFQQNGGLNGFNIISYNGNISFQTNGTNERMRIQSDGAILMPDVYSDLISGTTRDLYIKSDGQLGYISSTAKSKTNIYDLNNVDFIYNLNPVTFNYRKQNDKGEFTEDFYDKTSYGLIAEEVVDVADYMVYYDELEDGGFIPVGVNYSELITPMLKAIQQQKDEIDQLKTLITDLTNRLTILENK